VCQYFGVDLALLAIRGNRSPERGALAYLAREHTEATSAEMAPILGLSRPESVPNLTRRFAFMLERQARTRQDLSALETNLGVGNKTKNSV
jgi:hypothetical protein